MRDQHTHIKERRVYGQDDEAYDHFWPFKSKHKKKKEKLDIKQRESSIALTNQQNAIAKAIADTEKYKAKRAEMQALEALKQAKKAQVQLKGAETSGYLKYLMTGVALVALVGGGFVIFKMFQQAKNSKKIAARIEKAKALLNPKKLAVAK